MRLVQANIVSLEPVAAAKMIAGERLVGCMRPDLENGWVEEERDPIFEGAVADCIRVEMLALVVVEEASRSELAVVRAEEEGHPEVGRPVVSTSVTCLVE